jgi:hypothetical protein
MKRLSLACTGLLVLLAASSAGAAQELPKVDEEPVAVGRSLGRWLVRYDRGRMSAKACRFQPGVAFHFYQGDRSSQGQICFTCGEMALDGIEGIYGDKKMLSDADSDAWRRAARKAFPDKDFVELP